MEIKPYTPRGAPVDAEYEVSDRHAMCSMCDNDGTNICRDCRFDRLKQVETDGDKKTVSGLRFIIPRDPTIAVRHAYEMLASALEKQEPKKPTTYRREYVVLDGYCINYCCPVCNRRIVSKDSTGFFAGNTAEYCEKCGQKIDWSEVDDES